MRPARKNGAFCWWFARHVEKRLTRSFARIHGRQVDQTRALAEKGPLLVVSNHTSWWDPLVALFLVNRRMGLDGYAMMDQRNLQALPFLGLVGAFGVDLSGDRAAEPALRYSADLLDGPQRVVWIFPQGREKVSTERPLAFRRGSAVVARLAPQALVVPFALRYEMAGDEQPWLFLSFGDAQHPEETVDGERERQERAVAAELDRLDRGIEELSRKGKAPSDFKPLTRPPRRPLARASQRALTWLTRPR